jgi:hypothetical protein
MKFLILTIILYYITYIKCQKDELAINIIPSNKYRLNRKDLAYLKADIERSVQYSIFKLINIKANAKSI